MQLIFLFPVMNLKHDRSAELMWKKWQTQTPGSSYLFFFNRIPANRAQNIKYKDEVLFNSHKK